ncbi:hypothetical protein [Streptomyces sp. NRRL F-5630]|uniref:hypothetical protein n=1 Tax=Streptomyces sp. NRRL F-5630 TaxID=1463864 RepID=UPI003D71C673
MSALSDEAMVGRCYTKARRHPSLIARWPGGRGQIWGGPYTIPQAVVLGVTVVLMLLTREVWARFGLGNVVLLALVPYGVSLVVRYVRVDGRDPVSVAVSVAGLLGSALQSRESRRRPRQVIGACTVTYGVVPAGVGEDVVEVAEERVPLAELLSPAPAPAPVPVAVRVPDGGAGVVGSLVAARARKGGR